MLKTVGYLVSTASVFLIGVASWQGLSDKPMMRIVLALGMLTSIGGMFLRWLSYMAEQP